MRPVAEHLQAHLGEDGLFLARVRVEPVREERHPEEERAEDERHRDERLRRVLRLGLLERRDAVGDGLDAGERDGAGREALQHQEERQRPAALHQTRWPPAPS